MSQNDLDVPKPSWRNFRHFFIGLLLLSGLVLLTTHFGEVEQFTYLIRQVEPAWLLVALLLQFATYVSVASVWYLALKKTGNRRPLRVLIPLGVAKLSSDLALPSAGISGTAFFVAALKRLDVPNHICMSTLLLSLISYYAAYLSAAVVTVISLWFHDALNIWIGSVVVIFTLFAIGIPAGALWSKTLAVKRLPHYLSRIPGLQELVQAIEDAPRDLLRNSGLIVTTILLHSLIFVLDVTTLWVLLHLLGIHVSFFVVFPSFVLASIVATIGPIPLGLGTFELTCVTMLGAMRVPMEAALTATLMLRGFTLWMPMLPGMWLARRALR